MIENLVLDPDAIWDLLVPHRERVPFQSAGDVDVELRAIARELRHDEIRLRVQGALRPICVRLDLADQDGVGASLAQATEDFAVRLAALGTEEELAARVATAAASVDRILEERRELEAFRGNRILKEFHERHNLNRLFPYQAFVYEVAGRAKGRDRVTRLAEAATLRIQRYICAANPGSGARGRGRATGGRGRSPR
jgi:hypothetical protein